MFVKRDEGKTAPLPYTGHFKEELVKSSLENGGSIEVRFVDKSGISHSNSIIIKYDKDNGITLFNGANGKYYECLSKIRGSYTDDVTTWRRFLIKHAGLKPLNRTLTGSSRNVNLADFLGVNPQGKE
jgi:hypothetical protein